MYSNNSTFKKTYINSFINFLFGDNNYDGNIDILDIIIIINYIMDINELELSQIYASDINYDASISVEDIVMLLAIILE